MDVYNDGVKSMTGLVKSVVSQIKKNQNVPTSTMLYTVISWLQMLSNFSSVMDKVIKISIFSSLDRCEPEYFPLSAKIWKVSIAIYYCPHLYVG